MNAAWGDIITSMRFKVSRRAGVVISALAVVGWYGANRLLSPVWAVAVHRSTTPDGSLAKPFSGELRIGTFNIAHARGPGTQIIDNFRGGGPWARRQRLSAIADLLAQQELDLVVVNEIDFWASPSWYQNQARILAREAGFPFWVEQRNYDASLLLLAYKSGNAVLSRFPITEAQLVRYPIGRTTERLLFGEKQGVLCTVELRPGLSIRLLAVHLDHDSEAARIRSVEVIERLRHRSPTPLVLAGDFNSTAKDFPHSEVDSRGQSAVQLLLEAQAYRTAPTTSPGADDFTFPSRQPEKVIDWVFLPRPWRLLERRTMDSQVSDHRALVVVAELPDVAGGLR